MLILPIVNRRRILNVQISLKNAEKIREGVILENTNESEVLVNNKRFTKSSYNRVNSQHSVVDFIRNASIKTKKDYFITTRENSDSNKYDVYAVSQPKPKINKELDDLYESVVTDMRKEIPGIKRGRYISLKKLGLDRHLTDEKIALLQQIVEENDPSKWPLLFARAGIADLKDTLKFIDMFDCTVISKTTIPEDTLVNTIDSLEPLQSRDYRNLKNYYEMAKDNTEVYKKLSKINNVLYDKQYELIQSTRQRKEKEKQKVKVKKENEVNKAA